MKVEWKSCIRLGLTCFLVFLGIYYWVNIAHLGSVLLAAAGSLLTGCVIAYILNILMSFYEKYYFVKSKHRLVVKSRRMICMLLAMATLVVVIVVIIRLILPELLACVELLFKEVPLAMERLEAWLREQDYLKNVFTTEFAEAFFGTDWKVKIEQIITALMEGVGGAAQIAITAVSSTITLIMELVIGIIFAIYLLSGKEQLAVQFKRVIRRFLPDSWEPGVFHVITTIDGCFHRFIVGQCTEAVILGGLCAGGMLLLQLPYAVMVGALIGFTALIPVAGAYIGGAVGAFMIFTVSPGKAVIFLIYLVVLQQLEGNLIYPKVVGTSIGLPGIWVLAAVTIGGAVMGVPGMLIGVPLTAAAYQLLRQDIIRYEENACRSLIEAESAVSEETESILIEETEKKVVNTVPVKAKQTSKKHKKKKK